ncbi:MAG: TonB-dependent receptor, partial [Chitinophagaceae bacterium]
YTRYDGNHFGKVIWAANGLTSIKNWYDLDALKNDFTIYLKQQTQLAGNWNLFYDLQFRRVNYTMDGFRENPTLYVNNLFNFFNPKAGINYNKNNWKAYLSYSIANKEPNRDDFEASIAQQPKPERLHDIELGVEKNTGRYSWSATLYHMNYKDQLVLTGKINDVGAYTRTNIPESYRAGIELQGTKRIYPWLNVAANLALSQNKVLNFTEYIDDYDNGGQKITAFQKTDIAYSPSVVGSGSINFIPVKNGALSLLNKYVSKQYLDNTSNDSRVLNAFFTQDLRASYSIKKKWLKELAVMAQVNNLWGTKYEPNGYTYSYFAGGITTTENFYFPMAGRNFMIGVNLRL